MSIDKNQALEIICEAIKDLNEELDYESLQSPHEGTLIYGGFDGIDSLSLVSLIANIEQQVAKVTNKPLSLTDEEAMLFEESPYSNVGSLAEFVVDRVKRQASN